MHDIRLIRDNPEKFDAKMRLRNLSDISAEVLKLDEVRRKKIRDAEIALAERNNTSKKIGEAKASNNTEAFEK